MKRPIHHQTVGARRAVPLVKATNPVGQETGHGIGHGTPCPYGGGDADPCLRDGDYQKRYTPFRRGTARRALGVVDTGLGMVRRAPAGFTLVELVVVIVIIGILSVLGGQFIVAPIQGYVDLSRRAKLVDQAEMALRRMQRDIRAALPNSIQLVSNQEISFEITVDGSRYRRYPGGGRNDILDFTNSDSSFEMLGEPNEEIQRRLDSDGNVMSGEELDIVIYNTSPASAGNRKEVLAIKDVSTTSEPHYVVTFSPDNPSFPLSSPYQRFFILEKGIKSLVTYKCKMAEKELYRNDSLVTGNVDKPDASGPDEICKFTYNPGTTQRAGLVTLELTLTEAGETITLLHQVHVVNAP